MLYYNWNRYYMPNMGRYTAVDPLIQQTSYLYADNNPLKEYDYLALLSYDINEWVSACKCRVGKNMAYRAAQNIAYVIQRNEKKLFGCIKTYGSVIPGLRKNYKEFWYNCRLFYSVDGVGRAYNDGRIELGLGLCDAALNLKDDPGYDKLLLHEIFHIIIDRERFSSYKVYHQTVEGWASRCSVWR
jgi:hypothetical protein